MPPAVGNPLSFQLGKEREHRKSRHLARLIDVLPRIRRHLTSVLSTRQPTREFAMAAAIALIDATGIVRARPGTPRLSGARGAVSLLKSNVEVNGSSITLTFKAKGGKQVVKDVHAPRLVPAIKVLQRLPGAVCSSIGMPSRSGRIRVRDVNAFLCGRGVVQSLAQGFSDAARVVERGRRRCRAALERGRPDAAASAR